jgi:hypothetical protein
MPAPKISRAEFEFLARRAGLSLTEAQKVELYGAYAHLEALVAALDKPLDPAAEPATIFAPERSA